MWAQAHVVPLSVVTEPRLSVVTERRGFGARTNGTKIKGVQEESHRAVFETRKGAAARYNAGAPAAYAALPQATPKDGGAQVCQRASINVTEELAIIRGSGEGSAKGCSIFGVGGDV